MSSHSRVAVAAASIALAATLGACTHVEPDSPDDAAAEQTENASSTESGSGSRSSETETTTTTRSSASSSSATTSGTATSTAASSSKSPSKRDAKAVSDVAERFSTLAPASLFEQLDSCTPTGVAGSFDCSGPEIGQFQFFESDSKAASTAQLLTELRSSRVVEDSGDRLVGWSVLGTSAIITVVDVDKGQVLQQLISAEHDDPRERIYELGLADDAGHTGTGTSRSSARTTATDTAATSTAPSEPTS